MRRRRRLRKEEPEKANEKLSRKSRFQLFRIHVRINSESNASIPNLKVSPTPSRINNFAWAENFRRCGLPITEKPPSIKESC